MIDNKKAIRLLESNPRLFWGRVVQGFLKAGWNPPDPSSGIIDRIMQTIHELDSGLFVTTENQTLTPRQGEILVLIANGYTNNEVAKKLKISLSTVKFHMEELRTSLKAKNTAHAIGIALREGLIE